MTTMRLITIAISHYCEKARWALDRAGLPYTEESHPPLFHMWPVWRAGGGDTVPVLVADGKVFPDSTDILRFVDARAGLGLYPADPARRAEVEGLEELFDESLGPHVRRWIYNFVLPDAALTRRALTVGVRSHVSAMFAIGRPVIAAGMRKGMNITDESAQRSWVKIDEMFARADGLLADGRPFLTGDQFTAADLTFASLAAPLLGVDGYGPSHVPLPAFDALPLALRDAARPLQTRPAGALVARLYRDERRRVATPV
jgi:glutathione S-transferase